LSGRFPDFFLGRQPPQTEPNRSYPGLVKDTHCLQYRGQLHLTIEGDGPALALRKRTHPYATRFHYHEAASQFLSMLFRQTADGFRDLLPQGGWIPQKDDARGSAPRGIHQPPEIVVFG
jgi:hypothetical protein